VAALGIEYRKILGSQRPAEKRRSTVERVHRFAVVLEPEVEGGFTVRVPSLPEIVTFGKDADEALAMAEDDIRLVLEDCLARGEPISGQPSPRVREVTVTLARMSGRLPSVRASVSECKLLRSERVRHCERSQAISSTTRRAGWRLPRRPAGSSQ